MSKVSDSKENNSPDHRQRNEQFAANRSPIVKLVSGLAKGYSIFETIVSKWLCGAMVVFMMLFIVIEITSRKLFNYSFLGLVDLVSLSIVIVGFGAIGLVQKKQSHIRMDILQNKLAGKRSGFLAEAIVLVIMLGISAILIYAVGRLALRYYQNGYATPSVYFPQWPAAIFMPLGYLFLIVQLIVGIKQNISNFIRHKGELTKYDSLGNSL
jgi:TRAP-type C4-dicarboxylate transport system permease small subunit